MEALGTFYEYSTRNLKALQEAISLINGLSWKNSTKKAFNPKALVSGSTPFSFGARIWLANGFCRPKVVVTNDNGWRYFFRSQKT